MKHYNKLLLGAMMLTVSVSCADDSMIDNTVAVKPGSTAQYEYLNEYDVLKSYVNSGNPNFKLGAGILATDFNKRGSMYSLVCSNFDDVTAGNEMKHDAVVQADGSLSLSVIEKFVSNAQAAGISIYGHTLCWHSQQKTDYLNGLIAPIIIPGEAGDGNLLDLSGLKTGSLDGWTYYDPSITIVDGKGISGGKAIKLVSSSTASNPWDLVLKTPFMELVGSQCNGTFNIRSEQPGKGRVIYTDNFNETKYPWTDWTGSGAAEAFETTTEWQEVIMQCTLDDGATSYQCGFDLGYLPDVTYYIDINSLFVKGSDGEPSLIADTGFETGTLGDWEYWDNATGASTQEISALGEGYGDTGYAMKYTNPVKAQNWQIQIAHKFATPFIMDAEYNLSLYIKGSVAGTISSVIQKMSEDDGYPSNSFGDINVTTDWTRVDLNTVATRDDLDNLLFSVGDYEGTLYFDDVALRKVDTGDEVIEKTEEEKTKLITEALRSWIEGMMDATKDYIKAWDVVNEPMDDYPDPSKLKTGKGKELANGEFYWQDYLGEDYARLAVKFAREYGGDDLILFVNDYGLESTTQEKCQGLIKYIERWESDGVTRIDGIGTQMHVSYIIDEIDQAANEAAIVQMFKSLAATGKLIKITELDMGIKETGVWDSPVVLTGNTTFELMQKQSEFYKFIIKAYFEHIPAAQQYGISQWSPLDSPDVEHSWRRNEPIGLWDLNFNRKPAYAGFADGLKGE